MLVQPVTESKAISNRTTEHSGRAGFISRLPNELGESAQWGYSHRFRDRVGTDIRRIYMSSLGRRMRAAHTPLE